MPVRIRINNIGDIGPLLESLLPPMSGLIEAKVSLKPLEKSYVCEVSYLGVNGPFGPLEMSWSSECDKVIDATAIIHAARVYDLKDKDKVRLTNLFEDEEREERAKKVSDMITTILDNK
jgi:hypothetical protein